MTNNSLSVFLADDDIDDCFLFEDALNEIGLQARLTTANDGFELMEVLKTTVPPPPDVIFLDLNMPRKNGFECLAEIRSINKLKDIPVVIFSTSKETDFVDRVYNTGANFYLCKPHSFVNLKSAINKVLSIDWKEHNAQPTREHFLIT